MSLRRAALFLTTYCITTFLSNSSFAAFHFMQIEQVIGGVNCDITAQAIQLRMKSGDQNLVANSRIRVHDATGANPIVIVDIGSNVSNGAAGSRVLIASENFANHLSPNVTPDFLMTNLIPESYLAAGSLTFEADGGTVYWRLSWGGASYTGSGAGSTTNDADGNFNPPFAGLLPFDGLQALLFQGVASADSTSNAADYALTVGPATFTKNDTTSGTLAGLPPTGACCLPDNSCLDNQTACDCLAASGVFQGDGTSCKKIDCNPCPEDIAPKGSSNGQVDINDLRAIILNWGQSDSFADINGDGIVDINDLRGVILAWGPC